MSSSICQSPPLPNLGLDIDRCIIAKILEKLVASQLNIIVLYFEQQPQLLRLIIIIGGTGKKAKPDLNNQTTTKITVQYHTGNHKIYLGVS